VEVLRKRWEKAFGRRAREVEELRAAVASEAAAVEDRFRDLHARISELTEREAALNTRVERADVVALDWPAAAESPAGAAPTELGALREELGRLAAVLLDAELPDPPDGELPWGADDADRDDVLPFTQQAKAA
jgi:hypothetical protein